MLRLNDKNKAMMTVLVSDMPDHIRCNLMDDLKLIYPDQIRYKDTSQAGETDSFSSIHFSFYTRYSTRVIFFIILSMKSKLNECRRETKLLKMQIPALYEGKAKSKVILPRLSPDPVKNSWSIANIMNSSNCRWVLSFAGREKRCDIFSE
jgi:hypothetical protein